MAKPQLKKMAIMYDFDETLSTRNMQEFKLFPDLGIDDNIFWPEVEQSRKAGKMDRVLSFMYFIQKVAKEKGQPLTRKMLNDAGKDIQFYPGVEEWFDRINEYGNKHGVEIEHYLISSGLREIVDGCKIADKFKVLYACEYHYDENGIVDWPILGINYTNKTQFIYRINKGVLEVYDDDGVNAFMPKDQRSIPYENMIYIGDGSTDVPCMKLVKSKGGHSVAVYVPEKQKTAEQLLNEGRVSFCVPADYRDEQPLDKEIKKIIREINQK